MSDLSFHPSQQTSTPAYRIPEAATPANVDVEQIVWRQIQMMQMSGWRLERAWPGGADFMSQSQPAISTGVNLILCVLTLGLWIPVFLIMEASRPGPKHCRLTVDENGQAQYTETGSPKYAKTK